jgi:hypothetical protein
MRITQCTCINNNNVPVNSGIMITLGNLMTSFVIVCLEKQRLLFELQRKFKTRYRREQAKSCQTLFQPFRFCLPEKFFCFLLDSTNLYRATCQFSSMLIYCILAFKQLMNDQSMPKISQ